MRVQLHANVLLVDDRPENLFAMEALFSGENYRVISANSAQEALRVLLSEDVALILLDVQMPGLNGFELAELIRERERTQNTPIIFISATSVDDQYVFKGYSLGAVDYLTKPIQPEILKSKVGFFTRLFKQNQQIKYQANLLEKTNAELDRVNSELEERVKSRTAALEKVNLALEMELEIKKRAEARLATEHAITRSLASAGAIDDAAPGILKAFCDNMDAAIAAFWLWQPEEQEFVCEFIELGEDSPELKTFGRRTRELRFQDGKGLPGRAKTRGAPVWLTSDFKDSQFPRGELARKAGLNGMVGIPVRVGSEFYGVIEFFTRGSLESRPSLANMFDVVGSEIGQFMFRKKVEAEREALLIREKTLRQQAEKASRLKDEFLATVSHELRTPLNSILGWSQLLSLGKLNGDEVQNALETIHRNARSQAQLIDDLLDTSRLITGNLQIELSPTEVRPLIEAAMEMVKPAADAKSISVKMDVGEKIGSITCDPQRLQQMVWNLLTNAVKFTPRNGSVNVSCKLDDGQLEICVADTGIGIAHDFLPFVFERFRQEDSSSTRSHDGLGLGLSIVRHLSELHGGTASAESGGSGKGAVFRIRLPLSNVAKTTTESVPAESFSQNGVSGNQKLSGVRVLVVDDDADSCDMLKFALGSSGAEVKTSLSVSEALDRLADWTPHVLLTDINMPGEDGYSLITRLRASDDEQKSRLPAIALTAMARPEDGDKATSAGFQMHIPKPVEIEELIRAIVGLTDDPGFQNAAQPA